MDFKGSIVFWTWMTLRRSGGASGGSSTRRWPLSVAIVVAASLLLALDAVVNLFTVDLDFLGRIDTDTDLVAFYAQNSDGDIVIDYKAL